MFYGIIGCMTDEDRTRILTKHRDIGDHSWIMGHRFPISKIPILWHVLFRLGITFFLAGPTYGILASDLTDGYVTLLVCLILLFILLITWIPFLRMPYEVLVQKKHIILKSYIRTVRMELDELVSIKDEKGGRYTRFLSKRHSVLMPARIKGVPKLDSMIKTISPHVQITHYSQAKKILLPSVQIALVLFLLLGMSYCSDPRMFGDRQRAVQAIERYREVYGVYPEDLSELQEKITDIQFRWWYKYKTNGQSFKLAYYGGMMNDKSASYSSLTQKWEDKHH